MIEQPPDNMCLQWKQDVDISTRKTTTVKVTNNISNILMAILQVSQCQLGSEKTGEKCWLPNP